MKSIIKARSLSRDKIFKVEIMANYPIYREKDKEGNWMIVGTTHAYIEDLDIDLRGIHYLWKKGKFRIRFPCRKGEINGEPCLYMIFSFCSAEKQKLLKKAIQNALKEFSKTELFAKECPIKDCNN